MSLTSRQTKLIQHLKNSADYTTAKKLSSVLGVSSKTVRNDVNDINRLSTSEVIASKSGKGFLWVDYTGILETTTNVEENLPYEILTNIINQEKISIDDLVELFYISESTLNRIVKELNHVISSQNPSLCIVRQANYLMIDGSEEKRRYVFNLFLNQELENHRLDLGSYTDYFGAIDLKELSNFIYAYHKQSEIEMNDFAMVSFILHIAVLIERVRMGNYIKAMEKESIEPRIQALTQDFTTKLEQEFDLKIPPQELPYISQIYLGKYLDVDTVDEIKVSNLVEQLLLNLQQDFNIDFSEDATMKRYLTNHLISLYSRAKQGRFLGSPLIEELKRKFPFVYNISVFAADFIQNELNITFPDDEIAYISLHFLSGSENIKMGRKRKILLLCPYGLASRLLVKNKLQNQLNYAIDVTEAHSVFEMEQLLPQEWDLLLTTEHIKSKVTIPCYQFDTFLTDNDIQKIAELLKENQLSKAVLLRFFKEELFFPKQNFSDREEVISFLCDRLFEYDYCKADYIENVFAREKLSSTSYGNYYAIPHAIQRSALKDGVAVCSLKSPINWGGNKVQLVLLMAMKQERDEVLEDFFSQLVSILSEMKFVKKLSRQTEFSQFIALCEETKNR